jgi:plastocyanin
MALSGRRLVALLAVAAVGGGSLGAAAQAKPRAKETRKTAKRKAARVRAVKVSGAGGWVPTAALAAERAPLTGSDGATGGGGAPSGTAATSATTSTATTPTGSTPSSSPPTIQAVGVTLDDRSGYTARLSRPTVTAGAVVIQLINQGEDDHNLRVVPTDHAGSAVDFPLTSSGANTTQTLTLTPGAYRVFCTLTTPVNHETAGMNATLNVTSPTS